MALPIIPILVPVLVVAKLTSNEKKDPVTQHPLAECVPAPLEECVLDEYTSTTSTPQLVIDTNPSYAQRLYETCPTEE